MCFDKGHNTSQLNAIEGTVMPTDNQDKPEVPDTVSALVEEMGKQPDPMIRTHVMAPNPSGKVKEKKDG